LTLGVDLVVGNIFGSNTFNMVLLVGIDLFYDGSLLASASAIYAVTAAMVYCDSTLFPGVVVSCRKKCFWILESNAVLVILLILSALTIICCMDY